MAGGIYELRNFFTFVVALIALQKFGNVAKAKNKYKALQTRMFGAFAIALPRESFLSSRIVGASDKIG